MQQVCRTQRWGTPKTRFRNFLCRVWLTQKSKENKEKKDLKGNEKKKVREIKREAGTTRSEIKMAAKDAKKKKRNSRLDT